MAFCVQSERKMDYIKRNKYYIGPGRYFKSVENNNIIKKNRPPFQISTLRNSYYKIKDTPGPGSYDLIDNKSYINKESTYNSTNNNKNNNINNISSIIFNSSGLSKNTRNKKNNSIYVISENNNNTEEYITINNNKLPYISKEDNNKNEKNKNKSKLINNHLNIEAGSLQRIISIPSKDMNGYSYDLNKALNLLIDKTNTKEYIGPGKYDINPIQKPKYILEWSKTLNIKEIKKRKEKNKKEETIEELKHKGDIVPKIRLTKKTKSQLLKSHMIIGNTKKGLNDLNSKLFSYKINNKSNIFLYSRDSFILDKKEIPGPGYYTKDLTEEKNEKNKNEMNLYLGGFGSGCNRFIYKSKSMQDLGPTTYFIEKNKFVKNKPDIFSHLKNKRLIDDKIIIKKKENKIPGPGTYELSHSFINKSFCKGELMNYNKNRFKNEINENPGPGSYSFINDIKNNNKNIIKKKKINTTFDEEEEKKTEKFELIKKEKNKMPDVGTYNLEEVDSISNNIKMKFNPKISYYSPFLMSSGRFMYKNNKIDLPMYDTKYIQKNSNYIIFSKAKRFRRNKSNSITGPGSYELINNNQWNKKSFNKLFSS